jgi:hypothetical protein
MYSGVRTFVRTICTCCLACLLPAHLSSGARTPAKRLKETLANGRGVNEFAGRWLAVPRAGLRSVLGVWCLGGDGDREVALGYHWDEILGRFAGERNDIGKITDADRRRPVSADVGHCEPEGHHATSKAVRTVQL